jgi:signal transduction histidine kinase
MIMADNETDDTKWLVELPPTVQQNWLAVAIVVIVLLGFGIVVPFAGRPLAQLNAFFPCLDAVVFVTDLITSVLLFAEFSISRLRPLLALATGYFFTALIVVPHALTFAGAFSPNGLLGATNETGSWLFIFWHVGFAAALLAYAVLRKEKDAKKISETYTMTAIGWSVTIVGFLVCALAWLATAGSSLLPILVQDSTHLSRQVIYPVSFTILILAAGIAVLLSGKRSVLDQWLIVVALITILEMAFSGLLPNVRFSVGFYAGRVLSLFTSSIVLIVLLGETVRLHGRLAVSNLMLRRERDNKLMNLEAMADSILHEIRQPLTAISANSAAAVELIKRAPPDLEEALSALNDVVSEGQRTEQILQSIHNLFGKPKQEQELVDINDTALLALRIIRQDLNIHGVTTRTLLASELPPVIGHPGQLLEVFINLFHNAVEAMQGNEDDRRMLTVRTEHDGGKLIIAEVEDTGRGIGPEATSKVFDPFVTTKPQGMGLGLAICRTIIERHAGQLSASPAQPRGTIFRVVLPQTPLSQ